MHGYEYNTDVHTSASNSNAGISIGEQFGDIELFGNLMQFKDGRKPFWFSIGVGGSITSEPNAEGGVVYFGSCDKNFYAIDLETGKEIWRFSTGGVISHGCSISGDSLFFGSFDGNLYALDKNTGGLKWKFKTNAMVATKPTVDGDRVYLGALDGNLYVLNASTGELVWKYSTSGMLYTPLVLKDRVFFGFNNFYALDLNGRLVWRMDSPHIFMAAPATYDNGILFFGCFDSNFYAVNALDGKVKWRFKACDVTYLGNMWKNKVYFGSRDGNTYCVNKDTGSLIWKFPTNGFVIKPVLSGGGVYFGSYDNSFYALDAETGELKWKFNTNGMINYACIHQGKILFGSWDCNMYCLDMDGGLVWKFRTSMSSPSKLTPPETGVTKTAQTVWVDGSEEEKKKERVDSEFSDYGGEFRGSYIRKEKSDYASGMKRGYMN